MNVETLEQLLTDYGYHLPVVVVMPDGTHRKVETVESVTTEGGYPAVGIVVV